MINVQVYFAYDNGCDPSGAARALLRKALGDAALEIAADAHGKPYLPAMPQVHISLSHTRSAVACALAGCPVGVDIEHAARRVHATFAQRYFSPREQAAAKTPQEIIAVWTRKEALLKRDGTGLRSAIAALETAQRSDIVTVLHQGYCISVCCEQEMSELTVSEIALCS